MLFVSNDLPRRSHRKPCNLQDHLGPPCMITSSALQDRLARAIASLESWVRMGGFSKIGCRLWVDFGSHEWFYGHGYELIVVALAYGCRLIDFVGLWFGFGWWVCDLVLDGCGLWWAGGGGFAGGSCDRPHPLPLFMMLGQTHVNGWSHVIASQNGGLTNYIFPFRLRVYNGVTTYLIIGKIRKP